MTKELLTHEVDPKLKDVVSELSKGTYRIALPCLITNAGLSFLVFGIYTANLDALALGSICLGAGSVMLRSSISSEAVLGMTEAERLLLKKGLIGNIIASLHTFARYLPDNFWQVED